MKGCLIAGGALFLVLLLMGGCGVGEYNSIVAREEGIAAAWKEVQNQYQRRFDLIPQLVETVKGAADFEQSTLTEITEARATLGKLAVPDALTEDPARMEAFLKAQDQMSGALSRLLVAVENYPTLKANANFLSLQDQLEGTENRLATARRDHIAAIQTYNVAIRRFPASVVAGLFGFEKREQPEFAQEVTERPKVEFDFGK